MSITVGKCSGMELGMAGIIASSARTPREEKPSNPFIPLPWLALPKTLPWKLEAEKLMSREESVQGWIFPKPLNYFPPGDFFLSPILSCISLPTTQGAIERNLAFKARISSCGQWGNQMPIRVLPQSG